MFEEYIDYKRSFSPIGGECCVPEATEMIKFLKPVSSHPLILDLGSGEGGHTRRLRNLGYTVIPVDLDGSQFSDTVIADMHTLPSDWTNKFDQIFCSGTLEHSPAPFLALCEMKRVLKTGGVIVLNLPMENNVRMLQDAGHYAAISKVQMENQFCPKLGLKLIGYVAKTWSGEALHEEMYGEHQVMALEKL